MNTTSDFGEKRRGETTGSGVDERRNKLRTGKTYAGSESDSRIYQD
jgi:hypothetical protein